MTRSTSRAVSIVAALLAPACITRAGEARPLYPGERRPTAEVARLSGPIGSVDGQDVSQLGKSFALLPGCHIVQPASKIAEVDTTGPNAYVARVPPNIVYAMRMQAGHTYELEVRPRENTGQTSTDATIRAWDRDGAGHATPVAPVAANADLQTCGGSPP
jgi:hypothetical protein